MKYHSSLAARWLQDLGQDLRYALRSYRKMPGVAAVASLTLALGSGAATAVFSLVHAVLLRSLPYPDPKSLVYVWSPNSNIDAAPKELGPSNANYYDWQRLSHSFQDLAMFMQEPMRLAVQGESQERIGVVRVTGNLFRTLAIAPEIGRAIEPEDDRAGYGDVVVLSHSLWLRKFGGSRNILGQTIRLDARVYRIIGVMPSVFRYPSTWEIPDTVRSKTDNQVWVPLALTPAEKADTGYFSLGDGTVIGRLRPGVFVAQAQAEMNGIMAQILPLREGQAKGSSALVQTLNQAAFGDVEQEMMLLLASVGFVLLLTCGNVANLLLARYSGRVQEMGVRSALGAGRSRLIRFMVAEASLLGFTGGAVGTVLAYALVRVLVGLAPQSLPRVAETSVDLPVLLFALAASLFTGLLCGVLPAISASRIDFLTQLQAGGVRGVTTSSRTRHVLIACEVALSLVLITGAGLLVRSYVRLSAQGPGFAGDVLSTRIFIPERDTFEQRAALYRQVLQELRARPEVLAAGTNTNLPMGGGGSVGLLQVEGIPKQEKSSVHTRGVSPGYFETMGIPVLEGRVFEERDYESKLGLVVASEGFARQYFPGQSAIGKRLRGAADAPWEQIIGVVSNVKNYALEEPPLGEIYRVDKSPQPAIFFVLRGRVPALELSSVFRKIVLSKEPEAAIEAFRTMHDRTWESGAPRRFDTSILSGFAIMALVLTVVGLLGLVAHSVRMRTQELGLRMALGASRGNVFGLILGHGFRPLVTGAVAGLAGSWALTRYLSEMLYGVGATDPLTFIGAPLLLVMTGMAACAIAGVRAACIDPAVALRHE
jgi:predicted permease